MTTYNLNSPVGQLNLIEEGGFVTRLSWTDETSPGVDSHPALSQLRDYFAGERMHFKVPLKLNGTPFQKRVWAELQEIPYGETRTYGDIAKKLNSSPRAVGTACGANPIPVIVPCHRVTGANGALTGFSGGEGIKTKEWLLNWEKERLAAMDNLVAAYKALRQTLPQKPFYFIRHGQTEANNKHIVQGHEEWPLNAAGLEQAAALKAVMANAGVTDYFTSPMQRTVQTVEAITDTYTHMPEMKERHFGTWQGQHRDEMNLAKSAGQTIQGGENRDVFAKRVATGLQNVLQKSAVPAIVSHGGVFNILSDILDFSYSKPSNASVYYVTPPQSDNAADAWHIKKLHG